MKTTLTIEQSAELRAKGVSVDKASEKKREYTSLGYYIGYTSIFTLADIISLLPRVISDETGDYVLRIQPRQAIPGWILCYYDSPGQMKRIHQGLELIDVLYNCLIWAIDNKHVEFDYE